MNWRAAETRALVRGAFDALSADRPLKVQHQSDRSVALDIEDYLARRDYELSASTIRRHLRYVRHGANEGVPKRRINLGTVSSRRVPIAGAEHIMGATIEREPRRYRIRRCHGDTNCWLLAALRDDGTEIESNGGWITGYSIDHLLKQPHHLTPMPGDRVELVP